MTVVQRQEAQIRIITIDRPAVRNALPPGHLPRSRKRIKPTKTRAAQNDKLLTNRVIQTIYRRR